MKGRYNPHLHRYSSLFNESNNLNGHWNWLYFDPISASTSLPFSPHVVSYKLMEIFYLNEIEPLSKIATTVKVMHVWFESEVWNQAKSIWINYQRTAHSSFVNKWAICIWFLYAIAAHFYLTNRQIDTEEFNDVHWFQWLSNYIACCMTRKSYLSKSVFRHAIDVETLFD